MAKKVRAQPLLVMITTSDYERESICNEVYDYACRVRDNGGDRAKPGFDPSFLPVIYELKPDDDWTDERWHLANPNLDVSVSRESLRKIVLKAKETPALEAEVKRLHFNIRTKQAMQLISTAAWDACGKGEDGAAPDHVAGGADRPRLLRRARPGVDGRPGAACRSRSRCPTTGSRCCRSRGARRSG
jgi:phage terminase large subunit-like protein